MRNSHLHPPASLCTATQPGVQVRLAVICAAAVIAGGLALAAQQQTAGKPVPGSTQQQLSMAITLFATDDDRPDAEQLFLRVIQRAPVTTADGAAARYYLGRLYHRNYYMLRDSKALDRAAARYREVHNQALGQDRRGPWHGEARFYKSLAYLEQGKWKDVYESVEQLNPALDSEIEIDYLVWAIGKRSINRRVSTAMLKSQYQTILNRQNVTLKRRDGVDRRTTTAVIAGLQSTLERWPAGRAKAAASGAGLDIPAATVVR